MQRHMHRLVVILVWLMTGCSAQPFVMASDCAVYTFEGARTNGLIVPTPEMSSQFLHQLQERDRDRKYC